MKKRAILLGVAAVLAMGVVCFAADDMNMGTWKLNEAKSKFPAGATKNHTVVYEAAGDSIKVTVDGVTADGKAVHDEWTGKFDGTGRITVSADGKSRTVTVSLTDSMGKTMSSTAVYDKQ